MKLIKTSLSGAVVLLIFAILVVLSVRRLSSPDAETQAVIDAAQDGVREVDEYPLEVEFLDRPAVRFVDPDHAVVTGTYRHMTPWGPAKEGYAVGCEMGRTSSGENEHWRFRAWTNGHKASGWPPTWYRREPSPPTKEEKSAPARRFAGWPSKGRFSASFCPGPWKRPSFSAFSARWERFE